MPDPRQTVLVTGVAGNLGSRLLQQLQGFSVVGVDFASPSGDQQPLRLEQIDLGMEASCRQLVELLRDTGVTAVVHLAFVLDPLRTGVLDVDRMWQINVAGTARLMEAIAVVNRTGGSIGKFVYPSSVAVYGPETPPLVKENHPLGAHTLPYAIHKKEADEVVRLRAGALGACSTYVLRPHIFTGATMQNYMVGALRGTPSGKSERAERMRAKGTRLPMLLPYGEEYPQRQVQFVHVDDVARLIAFILRRPEAEPQLMVFNVTGRGNPITLARCADIAKARVRRLPGQGACRSVLRLLWSLGISSIPPEAWPYMIGSYTVDTSRLRAFLGKNYDSVIQHSVEAALADSFPTSH